MIDFKNGSVFKLSPSNSKSIYKLIEPILIEQEQIVAVFSSVRDSVIFTNKRIIAVNVQGVTGKKKDITSLPYKKVQAFSVETSGVFDMDCEMEIYFSTLGKIRFEFSGNVDIKNLSRIISHYIL